MAPKKKPEPKPKAPSGRERSPDVTRMCRLCATPQPETSYPPGEGTKLSGGWTCQPCIDGGVLALLPLRKTGLGERYDTTNLFAGYRVFKIPEKGDRVEFETEVRSPAGVFYAAGEAAFAFAANTAKMGNILRKQFPEARLQVTGDDGVTVLLFPARIDLFQRVARRVGAFKPRRVTQETRDRLAAAREAGNEAQRRNAARGAPTQGSLL